MTNSIPGGYLSATSLINLAEGGYKSISDLISYDPLLAHLGVNDAAPSYPQGVGADLKPLTITAVKNAGSRLVTVLRTEKGAGVSATDDHRILRAVVQENGYLLKMTALEDFTIGDLVVVNPRIEDGSLKMDMSPVVSITPSGIEDVYAVYVEGDNGNLLVNGIVNQGWTDSTVTV